ncbi:hypothetical protein Dimus_029912 [Dionaea muscipula]
MEIEVASLATATSGECERDEESVGFGGEEDEGAEVEDEKEFSGSVGERAEVGGRPCGVDGLESLAGMMGGRPCGVDEVVIIDIWGLGCNGQGHGLREPWTVENLEIVDDGAIKNLLNPSTVVDNGDENEMESTNLKVMRMR